MVNITGLAIGLASVLLVAMFIRDEYNFDRYHKNAERIYRIVLDFKEEGNIVSWARTSAPIGQYLRGAYPEIENVVRLRKNPGTDLLAHEDIQFFEERIFFADSSVFKIFDFGLVAGSPLYSLREKNSIVLTQALARKYFKDSDPIGKTLRLNNKVDLKVTGILQEVQSNSHIIPDALITFSTLDDFLGEKRLTHWGWMDHYTYVLLTKGSSPAALESKFPEFLKTNAPEWTSEKEELFLQPLTSIHLHSELKDEISPNSRETYSFILGTIALFILLMACANFINLSTATLVSRFKEIAIQKILGAGRIQLIAYFWIESIITCAISLIIAYCIMAIVLPYFNLATGKQMSLQETGWLLIPALLLTLLIGFISGIVPTLQSASANLVGKESSRSLTSKSGLRTTLITFQFCISILLVICTWIVTSQFMFLKSARHGFNSDNVLVLPIKDRSQNSKHTTITDELSKIPGVESVSFSSSMPAFNNAYTYTYTVQGSEAGEQTMGAFFVDENFFKLYDIQLSEGRLPNITNTDTLTDIVLNQAAVDQLALSNPLGRLVTGEVEGRVVGVVHDFNYESLHSPVKPMVMYPYPQNFRFVSIKFGDAHIQNKLSAVQKVWEQMYPGYPLEYFFLDTRIEQLYAAEFQLVKAYISFSIVAIVIAGIGLIGLTTYLMNRKLRELSIRKVFGSSTLQLIGWIYSGYFKVVIISILIAWGISYYWMKSWLAEFAFQTEIKLVHFLYPAVIMIGILLLTTIFQTVKASGTNPVTHLRNE